MKHFFRYVLGMCAISFLIGCFYTRPQIKPIDDNNHPFELITESQFELLKDTVNIAVMERYPDVVFCEAGAAVDSIDNLGLHVAPNSFYMVYNASKRSFSVKANLIDGKIEFEEHDDIWMEDIPTVVYVGLTAADAIKIIKSKFRINIDSGCPIVQRHALYINEIEPKFFVGTAAGYHQVGCYSGNVE